MTATVTADISGRELVVPLPDGAHPTDPGPHGPALLAVGAGTPPVPVVTAVVTTPVGVDASLGALREEVRGLALVDVDRRSVPGAVVTFLHPGVDTDVVTVQRLLEDPQLAVTVSYSWPVGPAAPELVMLTDLAREVTW